MKRLWSCRVEAALQHWYVTGLLQQGAVPSLIASVGDASSSLLSVLFELNPEESAADQLLRVHSQPVEIIYDAVNRKQDVTSDHMTHLLKQVMNHQSDTCVSCRLSSS